MIKKILIANFVSLVVKAAPCMKLAVWNDVTPDIYNYVNNIVKNKA